MNATPAVRSVRRVDSLYANGRICKAGRKVELSEDPSNG